MTNRSDLLDAAVAAHGGIERWRAVASIDADVSAHGALWQVKGQPDVLADVAIRVGTEDERS